MYIYTRVPGALRRGIMAKDKESLLRSGKKSKLEMILIMIITEKKVYAGFTM